MTIVRVQHQTGHGDEVTRAILRYPFAVAVVALWQVADFDVKADRWLTHLSQAAEWFPLLGLIGTVAAILQTFSSIKPGVTPQDIIHTYAPAITATGGGLYMAFINILPIWVVAVGRDLIRALAGFAPPPEPASPESKL